VFRIVVPTFTLSSKSTVFSTQIAGVGPADGDALGVADGEALGLADGTSLGLADGEALGAALTVGMSDGALLG
jgi:hypothetical protein